ncbi:MAG: hypothetical protein IPL78_03890 [Chloroflexi bacterium]|nr:hypothetical protein [Chloroflexota bacterium]
MTRQAMTNRAGMIATLSGLAAVLAEQTERQVTASRLLGAVQAALGQSYVWLDALDRQMMARTQARLVADMGEEAFAAACQAGELLTLGEAVGEVERLRDWRLETDFSETW